MFVGICGILTHAVSKLGVLILTKRIKLVGQFGSAGIVQVTHYARKRLMSLFLLVPALSVQPRSFATYL